MECHSSLFFAQTLKFWQLWSSLCCKHNEQVFVHSCFCSQSDTCIVISRVTTCPQNLPITPVVWCMHSVAPLSSLNKLNSLVFCGTHGTWYISDQFSSVMFCGAHGTWPIICCWQYINIPHKDVTVYTIEGLLPWWQGHTQDFWIGVSDHCAMKIKTTPAILWNSTHIGVHCWCSCIVAVADWRSLTNWLGLSTGSWLDWAWDRTWRAISALLHCWL